MKLKTILVACILFFNYSFLNGQVKISITIVSPDSAYIECKQNDTIVYDWSELKFNLPEGSLIINNKTDKENFIIRLRGLGNQNPVNIVFNDRMIPKNLEKEYKLENNELFISITNRKPLSTLQNIDINQATKALKIGMPKNVEKEGVNSSPKNNPEFKTGTIIYDAIALSNYEKLKMDNYLKILKQYSLDPASIKDMETALKQVQLNKLLHQHVVRAKEFYDNPPPGVQSTGAGSVISAAGQFLGGLDVTNIADGFAKFLVKRTKEELNIAFFEKFKKEIHDNKYIDAQILFPHTYLVLDAIGEEIYKFNSYIQSLREAFEKDLRALLVNLPEVVESGSYSDYFNKHPYLKFTCLSAFYIINEIIDDTHPGQMLEEFPEDYINKLREQNGDGYNNLAGALQTLQLISTSLKSDDEDNYWVKKEELKKLLEPETFKIYLGLLNAKAAHIKYGGNKSLCEAINSLVAQEEKIKPYIEFVRGLSKHYEKIGSLIKNFKEQKEKDSLSFDNYYRYYNAAIDLFEYADKIRQLPGLEIKLDTSFKKYIRIARTAADLGLDISRRNYSSAIMNAVHIYDFAFNSNNAMIAAAVKKEKEGKAEGEQKYLAYTGTFKKTLIKYGTFMASMVEAKNSDEIEKVIEAVALPAGSSRIKRESAFNVSLNAYVGLFAGYEKIKKVDSVFKPNNWGITAPIGVAVSWGGCKKNNDRGGKSFSVFFSIVDLGAITSFRFTNDSASKIPSVQLGDIVSPGFYLSYGLGRSPLSVSLGIQSGPRLRKVSETLATKAGSNYTRYSLSFAVDIPILNFYTKPK